MDFGLKNIWSKTGLKSKDQNTDESDVPVQEKSEESTETTEGVKDGTLMCHFSLSR